EAPLGFVPKRWEKHVYGEGGRINRHYYEMAALTELKNRIRSGDVYVVGSRLHKDFEEYLVGKEDWKTIAIEETNLAVSSSAEDYLETQKKALNQRFTWISNNLDNLEGVNITQSKLQLNRLEK